MSRPRRRSRAPASSTSPPMCRARPRAARGARLQAVVERDAARPEPAGGRGLSRQRRPAARLSGRLGAHPARGDRRGLRPQSGAHRLRRRLGRAADAARPDLSRAGRRGDLHRSTASSSTGSPSSPPAATPVVAPETRRHGRRRRDPGARHAAHAASSSSPTRTTRPAPTCRSDEVRRLHAGLPADVLLVLDAAYAEYVRRNDYASGIELAADGGERRDDAHLLEDLRPRRPPHRLGLWAGACDRRAQPHPRPVQRQRPGASRPAPRRSPTARISSAPSRTTQTGSPG